MHFLVFPNPSTPLFLGEQILYQYMEIRAPQILQKEQTLLYSQLTLLDFDV